MYLTPLELQIIYCLKKEAGGSEIYVDYNFYKQFPLHVSIVERSLKRLQEKGVILTKFKIDTSGMCWLFVRFTFKGLFIAHTIKEDP